MCTRGVGCMYEGSEGCVYKGSVGCVYEGSVGCVYEGSGVYVQVECMVGLYWGMNMNIGVAALCYSAFLAQPIY